MVNTAGEEKPDPSEKVVFLTVFAVHNGVCRSAKSICHVFATTIVVLFDQCRIQIDNLMTIETLLVLLLVSGT